jgi:DUF4097 and DUF4098 domain-containing protein YvlB
MRYGLVLVSIAALYAQDSTLYAQDSTLIREGEFWIQTTTGIELTPPGARLRISTRGSVTVRGGAEDQIKFTVVKRVKARREAEARELLRQFLVKSYRQGDLTGLTVVHGGDGWGGADLHVTVPRSAREAFLDTRGGRVDAADFGGSLRVETGGGAIRLDRIGGSITAITAGGEIDLGSIGGDAICTSAGGPIRAGTIGGRSELETAGGDIVVDEAGGPLRARTAGGGVRITRAGAAVIANTAGGAVDVGSAQGLVRVENASGPVRIGSAGGAQIETGGGGIRLGSVSGSLRASTSVGNVFAQLVAGAPMQDSFLITELGDITVLLPSNLGMRILAQIDSGGRIVSEFPGVRERKGDRTIAEGTINGGGPLLRLTCSNGTIYIRRAR